MDGADVWRRVGAGGGIRTGRSQPLPEASTTAGIRIVRESSGLLVCFFPPKFSKKEWGRQKQTESFFCATERDSGSRGVRNT